MIPGIKTMGIALGIVVMLLVVAGFSMLSIAVNTNGESFSEKGVMGNSIAGGVSEGHPMKDVLDSTSYVTAWTSGGYGEKIVIRGQVKWKNSDGAIFSPALQSYYYKVTFEGNAPLGTIMINGEKFSGGTINWQSKEIVQHISFSNKYDVKALEGVILNIQNPFNGKVRVELWGGVDQDFGHYEGKLASDEANLKDGIGKIDIPNRVVEEDTDLIMYVTTGASHSVADPTDTGGWKLMISDPSGTIVYTTTMQDGLIASKKTWTVPEGSYRASWNNTFYVTLRNELIDQDQKFFFTVGQGMIKDIPSMPSFEKVSGADTPYHPGDQVIIKVSSHSKTYPIVRFDVWLEKVSSEGQVYDYIWRQKAFDAVLDGAGVYSATITITFNDVGYYKMEASAVDSCPTGALHSEVAAYDFRTFDDDDGPPPFEGFDWLQIALIIGAILVLIGAIFLFVPGIPPVLKTLGWVLLIIGIALLICYAVVSFGLIKAAPVMIGGLLK